MAEQVSFVLTTKTSKQCELVFPQFSSITSRFSYNRNSISELGGALHSVFAVVSSCCECIQAPFCSRNDILKIYKNKSLLIVEIYQCLNGLFFFLVVDSDSDNFQSLKKGSSSKQNGSSKSTKLATDSTRPGVKTRTKSPIKPSSTQSKTTLKSPVTPKSAEPQQLKRTPTSVFDYFGSAAIQRSDKKLVASTKRKAVSAN